MRITTSTRKMEVGDRAEDVVLTDRSLLSLIDRITAETKALDPAVLSVTIDLKVSMRRLVDPAAAETKPTTAPTGQGAADE